MFHNLMLFAFGACGAEPVPGFIYTAPECMMSLTEDDVAGSGPFW